MRSVSTVLLLLLAFAVAPAVVEAQRPMAQVLDLNRQGMDAYNNLDLESAQRLLAQAARVAQRGGVTGAALARTYINQGVVSIGGFQDNGSGLNFFVQALRADPSVQLDPLTSTPDIQSVFTLAQRRAGASPGPAPAPAPAPAPGPGPGPGPSSSGSGNIPHQPAMEQLVSTPVPVFVDVPADAPVAHIYLYYKSTGMREFHRVEMQQMAGGYGYEIPCSDVFQPEVDYYIVAFGTDGSPLGFAGTQQEPMSVPIVAERTQPPPALPGRAPPEQCHETECPPGMAGCESHGSAGLGDTCRGNTDCASGLTCDDDLCVTDLHPGGLDADDGEAPRFFAHIGFTAGFGLASSGSPADSVPQDPTNACASLGGDAYTDCITGNAIAPDGMTTLSANSSYEASTADGCGADDGSYCVRLESGGLLPALALRTTIGYWIIPRFALAATVRFQFDAGQGSLANLLLGARAQYRITEPMATGIDASAFIGASYGQIQLKPPQNGAEEPYIISGLNGVQVGGVIAYRFMPNFGVHFTPEIHLLFPTFLIVIDLTAGIEVAF